jgi:phosphatidate cytidylyltransferase
MYFLYGESVVYYFKHIVLIDVILLPFATHHRFISFMLYVIGMYALAVLSCYGRSCETTQV